MFCQPGYNFFARELASSTYNYLEIGVFNGDSIAGLAKIHPNKIVFGVDPFIEDGCTTEHTQVSENETMTTQRENTYANTNGLENIVLFEMLSSDFANMLTDEMIADMNVAWVLIDGSHYYPDVINDVHMSMRLIGDREGGIVFDDLNLEGVARAHKEFLNTYQDRISSARDIYDTHPGHIIAYKIN
jgi:hypothetical protein